MERAFIRNVIFSVALAIAFSDILLLDLPILSIVAVLLALLGIAQIYYYKLEKLGIDV
jgi:hypothetical protein